MGHLSKLLILICFGILLLPSTAWASRSTIENGILLVPRIDIDGYGAMQLTFRVSFDSHYRFVLEEAVETSLSTENAGVFDPSMMEIELFEIELENGAIYTARLGMSSGSGGSVFELLEAQLINNSVPAPSPADPHAATLFGQLCTSCHGATGLGTAIGPSLVACANCGNVNVLADYIRNTMPLGAAASCDAVCAATLSNYILVAFNSSNQQVYGQTVGFIQTLSATDTVRKAAMELLGRFPTLAEFQQAATGSEAALAQVIDEMTLEPEFYVRLTEIFNDYLLTDKYISSNGSDAALRLLDVNDFPNLWWFDPDSSNRAANYDYLKRAANDGVAREPLELINYIVRNNRPFTEIITADYLMVNPFSARSYGVEGVAFSNPEDASEFQPARLHGIPHAGILTSAMFLNRYPTTATNRNRGRARVVFDLFLDTDILAIEGVRPGNAVDITNAVPTIDNPECSKCHSVVDPVASIFQNWDSRGRYRPARLDRGWYTDMEQRGFNGQSMPLTGNIDSSVRWLGRQIAVDPKFPRAVLRILVRGLTGKEPLEAPLDNAIQAQRDAYVSERTVFNEIQQKFVADSYNLRTMVREIILNPYWRAADLTGDASQLVHHNTGSSHLLTPEQLDRKIEALMGFEWRGTMDNYHQEKAKLSSSRLLAKFHQIYGGIDSDDITTRLTSPNGMMGAMQLRMANELACYAVPEDFLRPANERRLFPFVDLDTLPYDASGFLREQTMNSIRQNIQYLHDYLLRESYLLGTGELRVTEELFLNVLNIGRQSILDGGAKSNAIYLPSYCKRSRDLQGNSLNPTGGTDRRLQEDRQYVVRAWMAVLAYLLADYRFVYE